MSQKNELLSIRIIHSKIENYKINQEYKIEMKRYLGSGSYGVVFDIGNQYVMKLYFHCTLGKTHFQEKECIIPFKNENRELALYFEMIKADIRRHYENHVISPLVIGYTLQDVEYKDELFKKETYFVILPYCIPFYQVYRVKNIPLLEMKKHDFFIYEFMYRIFTSAIYLEKEYRVVNLDYKLANVMYLMDTSFIPKEDVFEFQNIQTEENEKKYHEQMLVIDFGLMKRKNTHLKFQLEENDKQEENFQYYVWPNENENFLIHHIPSYSIAMCVFELLFGKENVVDFPNENKREEYLMEIRKKNIKLAYFLSQCLIAKKTTKESYILFDSLFMK